MVAKRKRNGGEGDGESGGEKKDGGEKRGNGLTDFENTLCATFASRQAGVVIQSLEEPRVLESLRLVIRSLRAVTGLRDMTVWSAVSQRRERLRPGAEAEGEFAVEHVEEHEPLPMALRSFLDQKVEVQGDTVNGPGLLVLCDIDGLFANDPVDLPRRLREACWEIGERSLPKSIVLIGKAFTMPEELGADFRIFPFGLPSVREIEEVCRGILDYYRSRPSHSGIVADDADVGAFAQACGGLTECEARGLLRLAITKYQAIDKRATALAIREKGQIVRRSGILDVVEPRHRLEDLGGLQHLKAYVLEMAAMFRDRAAADAFGLQPCGGLLMTGIPGCGKSAMAEAIASALQRTLVRFDVGRAFGGLVGESEANIRTVQQVAEAVAPCVVMLDEVEKALGGGGGERDGGTSARVKQSMLSWLNDKPKDVLVVATANDLTALEGMPELIRAGRFDEVFFVDLPDLRSRIEILAIHLRRTGHTMKPADLEKAARAAKGFSGAELEVAVQSSLRAAFLAKPRRTNPTPEMLVRAIAGMVPLSVSMAGPIGGLRQWVKAGKAKPAGATLESDAADAQSLKDEGLPLLLGS